MVWGSSDWQALNDEEREREYSPSSCLIDGDYRPFVRAYRERSDAGWATVEQRPDVETAVVAYGPAESQTIDVAIPGGAQRPPLVLYIHGGYWQELSKVDSRFAAQSCVDRGWAFAAADYTLAPKASLDEIVGEMRAALAALHNQANVLGFDPERVVLAGSSAGAHLAAMTAIAERSVTGPVAATVLVSGIYDLEPLIGTTINDALGLDVEAARRNSPLRLPPQRLPPTLLVVGSVETEQFKAQTAAFAAQLKAAGTEVRHIEVSGKNHFDVILDLAEPHTELGDAVAALLHGLGSSSAQTR